ncbi:MAG: HipA domain-containing protein [Ruminococcus sp.]|nr:HipA domain-containing protein [Ruminococcus sp.]
MGISSFDKYEHHGAGYLKKIFQLLRHYSANPIEDHLKLWDMEIFNYLIGNTDNHIKNLSLIYGENLKSIRLAPAYDMISTTIYESSTRDMSVSVDGIYRIDDIKRASFQREAENIGFGTGMAMKRFDSLAESFESALKKALISFPSAGLILRLHRRALNGL